MRTNLWISMAIRRFRGYFVAATFLAAIGLFVLGSIQKPFAAHRLQKHGIADGAGDSPHYLLNTPGCTILDIDPDHPSVVAYKSKEHDVLVCSPFQPLTEDSGRFLFFYEDRLPEYGLTKEVAECYYEGLERSEQDPDSYDENCDKLWITKPKIPIREKKIPIKDESLLVTCIDKSKNNTAFYHSSHFFIQPWRVARKRRIFKEKYGERKKEQLSVIFLGTDAVSRGNLRRHMPKTFKFLKDNLQVIDLQGFNKVADDTDPNLTAYLMGLSYDELEAHQCTNKKMSMYDDCPLIWKDFESKDYATAYAEDSPWMGAFHFKKVGFCKQPTDYYNRPFFYASDNIIGHNAKRKGYKGKLCQGVRSSISLIHEYSLKIAEELRDIPYFGFYWTASVTHDILISTEMADEPSLDFLKKLQAGGYLEHTVLFFVSDHGLRYGSFRLTYAGMLEERMSYITMAFPRWFQEKYPEAMRNLKINTRRLTASYDVHATLHAILDGSYANPEESKDIGYYGISLFKEIPKDRTCEDARIPEHFCACQNSKEADPEDPHLLEAAKETINDINKSLEQFPSCFQLSLVKVLNGRIGTAGSSLMPENIDTIPTSYLVTFVTKPGDAVMESTLKYHGGVYELTADASRLNEYGNQSHCIKDHVLRKYCYCKDMLPEI